jgi:putative ABC transport system permease protein
VVALLTLALGIGATSAIFTVVNSVLLRPLPFHDPKNLFVVLPAQANGTPLRFTSMSDRELDTYQRERGSIEHIAGVRGGMATMLGAGEPASVLTRSVTPNFWPLLGTQPALGRVFTADERDVVVLSDRLWHSRFGANPSALGRSIQLDGKSFVVAGVMPPAFDYPADTELWMPLVLRPQERGNSSLQVIARPRAGVTQAQAQSDLSAVAARQTNGRQSVRLISLHERIVGNAKLSLWVLFGAVGFLLLIACVNVANLLVARGARRANEFATRAALGASRWRLTRQLIVESLVLSTLGSALGLLVAAWGRSALIAIAPVARLPRLSEIQIDGWVLGFTVVMAALTGVLFGLAPALQLSRAGLHESIKRGSTRLAGSRLRGALVVAEIALTLVLLTGAGLLIRSFVKLRSVPTGFESQNVLTMAVSLPDNTYKDRTQILGFHREMLARIAPLPGVTAAGAVNWLPFGGMLISGDFYPEGRPGAKSPFNVTKPCVSNDYFRAMGIRLLRGRFFNDQDRQDAPGVAIIGESVARNVWPGEDPIGKRLTLEDKPKPEEWLTVVGVVEDVQQTDLSKEPPRAVYQPLPQTKRAFFLSNMAYIVRTSGDPRLVAGLLRERLREVDPNQPVMSMSTMQDLLANSVAEPRFQSSVLGAFAFAALALAMVGIYGVMSYAVAGRTREIGIRMALGAERRNVLALVLRQSAVLVILGITLGLGGAFAATRVLHDLLFEVKPTDPLTFAAVAGLLAVVGLGAALVPARTATRVDPVTALRSE